MKKYPIRFDESMNTVLSQELLRYNGLINVVRSSLADLRKALKGLVVMSGDLEEVRAQCVASQNCTQCTTCRAWKCCVSAYCLVSLQQSWQVQKAMNSNKVPPLWAKKSYPSLKPLGSFMTDFLARLAFFQK